MPSRRNTSELESAKSLWSLRRYDEALEAFARALKRAPNDEVALVDAARAFGLRYDYPRAEKLIDRLLRVHGSRPEIQCLCGETYRMLGRFREAAACFERACAARGGVPRARVELAEMYERLHDLDRASAEATAALACDRGFARAALVKARVHRRRGEFEDALRVLAEQLAVPPPKPDVEASLWGERALAYDQLGEYDKAFEAASAGKRILRAQERGPLERSEAIRRQSERMLGEITAKHFQRWRDALPDAPPLPVALLTGHPRSGTTLLEQVLDSHQGLVSSDERQVFADDVFPALGAGLSPADYAMPGMLDQTPDKRVLAERARYFRYVEALLGEPVGDRVHLDKNPELTLLIPAMLRVFPELKVIVAVRDPRDVVVSCFMRPMPLNSVTVNYLTLERTAEKYALMMGGWIRMRQLMASPWLEIRYEDVVCDLETQARRALDFLQLPWDDRVLQFHEHARQKHVRSPTYDDVTSPVYGSAMGRWRNYAKYLEPAMDKLEPFLAEFGYG